MNVAQYFFRLPSRLFGEEQVPLAIPPIPSEVILDIEKRLGLLFTAETPELNLCLAQSEEFLPDFRTSFSAQELLQALYALYTAAPSQPTTPTEVQFSFPTDPNLFWNLVEFGKQLLIMHTLYFNLSEHQRSFFPLKTIPKVQPKPAVVGFEPNPATPEKGRIWINGNQYLDHVPTSIWECPINGIAPAREYLQRHREGPLTPPQMLQFQQVLFALSETVRIREAIQKLDIEEIRFPIS